jgi:hypothetical protein
MILDQVNHTINNSNVAAQFEQLQEIGMQPETSNDRKITQVKINKDFKRHNKSRMVKQYYSWNIDEVDSFLIWENRCNIIFSQSFDRGSLIIQKREFAPQFSVEFIDKDKKIFLGELFWGIFRLKERNQFSYLDFSQLAINEKVTPIINFENIKWNNLPIPINEKAAAKELILDLIDDWYKSISDEFYSYHENEIFENASVQCFRPKKLIIYVPGIIWYKKAGEIEFHAIRSRGEEDILEIEKLIYSNRHFGKAVLIKDEECYRSAWKPRLGIFAPTNDDKIRILSNNVLNEHVVNHHNIAD